ncbi:predicted protein [Lichtheimia corymbifera JMRC:FSU:9682]|uniref:Uncharacterized protein n=1 Tax=Lichtheimia corymbifera JMRC:FSU:9682 TaxID=1263082 RepID=A0A068RHS7_9FUNG|nr:predicted protein [Lichtheimia corymbifera JMRC:FSU:9682]
MLNVDNDHDDDGDEQQEEIQHTIHELQPMSADQYRSLLAGYEQHGHTAHTAKLIYGRLSSVPLQVPSDKFEQFYCTSLLWHSIIDMLDAPRMQQNDQENTRPSDRANNLCADYIARDAATRVSAQLVPVIGSIQRATNAYNTTVDISHQMAAQLAIHTEMVATWMQESHEKTVAAHQ